MICRWISLPLLGLVVGCGASDTEAAPAAKLPREARQVLVVRATSAATPTQAKVTAWSRTGTKWKEAMPPMDAVIGRKGFKPSDVKKEGDGCTPTGVYILDRAFGYEPRIACGLEYQQLKETDYWIDDPDDPNYNRWVVGKPAKSSAEKLKRDDDLYKMAVVIEYNTRPIVPGKGSAIFLHVWKDKSTPTAGCVALAESDVRAILAWLDQKENPVISIGRY